MNSDADEVACMIDNTGHRVDQWLPHMQSGAFLRASIARGERTAQCWTELMARNHRVARGMAILKAARHG